MAKIVFQKKQYHLGLYDDIEEAALARRQAEKTLFDDTAAFYEKWKQKADKEPAWAKENPVQIFVNKNKQGELIVRFLPKVI